MIIDSLGLDAVCMYVCMCVCVCVYEYMLVKGKRERQVDMR